MTPTAQPPDLLEIRSYYMDRLNSAATILVCGNFQVGLDVANTVKDAIATLRKYADHIEEYGERVFLLAREPQRLKEIQ